MDNYNCDHYFTIRKCANSSFIDECVAAINCVSCVGVNFCYDCYELANSSFCFKCSGRNLICCSDMTNTDEAAYYVFNKKVNKESFELYQKFIAEIVADIDFLDVNPTARNMLIWSKEVRITNLINNLPGADLGIATSIIYCLPNGGNSQN